MSHPNPPAAADASHDAIEAALMETAPGRRFLAEVSRRNRVADTRTLLAAISRLETAVSGPPLRDGVERLRRDLADMTGAIARTKAEVAGLAAGQGGAESLGEASAALDGIVRTTERATSDILDATEKVQEIAWTMREAGADPILCDSLDRRATDIYAACEFQDLTAQRISSVVRMLAYLEERLGTMNRIWSLHSVDGGRVAPRAEPASLALTQCDIDFVIVDGEPFGEAPANDAAASLAAAEPDGAPSATVAAAFAGLDALGTREKLRLFT